jgi:Na+-transporting methylmalonyl-CoA/oxaloacetate decarboxylase gamma subunit
MKIKGWDIGLLFLILLIATVGARIFYIYCFMDDIVISKNVHNQMEVIGLSSVFGDNFSLMTLYFLALELVSYMVGSLESAVVCLNVIFQCLTIIILFWYIYYVSRKYYCFRLSMILAVFPAYIYKISSVDSYNMSVFLMLVLLILVLTIYSKIVMAFSKNSDNIDNKEDSSMREIVMAENETTEVKMIDNPLPMPKRREHKEMDFAIELTPENDDFDIKELPEGDDFDID